ncbi:SdpI family protein [Corynebacterium bovis]|uniref:SdpI family protein n=1 Tax=Corynebacterium bovis TaxID=36808 RepID=UPI00244B20A8|nr:SdpI family protein [Corynebacterium bovis]MDH2456807.1 SdpI family protein [Corynebacterium bovis]
MIILAVLLVVVGLAVLVVGVMGLTGTLPGNSVVGLRVPEVRASRTMWVTGHRIAGPAWIGSGVAVVAAGLVAWRASGWGWLVVALLVVGGLFLLGMGAALAAHAVARIELRKGQEAEARRASAGCCSGGGAGRGAGTAGRAAAPTAAPDLDAARRAAAAQDGR